MTAAENLRTVCAIAQVPGISLSGLSFSFTIGREIGLSLEGLALLTDSEICQRLSWDVAQARTFRGHVQAPLDRYAVLASRGIRVSTALDSHMPAWPKRLPTTPWLFYRGDLDILNMPAIGFSGSRDAIDIALDVTRSIATEAVAQGMTVISGGARGVDMAAHVAALAAGGSTAALLPQGLDTWWAPIPLADPSSRERLLVITTDLPWSLWTTVSAMQRNRAIVDLADVITIPQAGITGGSHTTGMYALGRKRDLWVAELDGDTPGNQLLMDRGAKPIPMIHGVPDVARMRISKPVAPAQQSLF